MENPILTAEELKRFAEYEKKHNLAPTSENTLKQLDVDPETEKLFQTPPEAERSQAQPAQTISTQPASYTNNTATYLRKPDSDKAAVISRYNKTHATPKFKQEEKPKKITSKIQPQAQLNRPQPMYKPARVLTQPTLLELKKVPIGDWISWSCTPHNDDEIRQRLLTMPIADTCISYVCRYSTLSPEFLDEFIALSTGWFHKPGCDELAQTQPIPYTPENLQFVIKLCTAKLTMSHEKYSEMVKNNEIVYPEKLLAAQAALPNNSPAKLSTSLERMYAICADRVDWYYLQRHQTLSPESLHKYSNYINKVLLSDANAAMLEINKSLDNLI